MDQRKVAIIGAGMAGLSAGLFLNAAGMDVRLFDKGRSPGGRVSTRRVPVTAPGSGARSFLFDHGAQFVRARTPSLLSWLKQQTEGGAVQNWEIGGEGEEAGSRFIGAPGMSSIPRALAEALAVETGRLVSAIHRQKDQWRLEFDEAGIKRISSAFDLVILAIPAPQAAKLVAPICNDAHAMAEDATYDPCWAGLFAAPGNAFGGLRSGSIQDDLVLAWVGRRWDRHPVEAGDGAIDCVVVHATADWSRGNLERESGDVVGALRERLMAHAGSEFTPIYEAAHRWRYAIVERSVAKTCLWYDDLMLGLCGDWLHGPTVESAWISGQTLAREIMKAP